MSDDVIVRVDHLHALGYCNRGARAWFARYGMDWTAFVAHGLPAAELTRTGDAMALRAAAFATAAHNTECEAT